MISTTLEELEKFKEALAEHAKAIAKFRAAVAEREPEAPHLYQSEMMLALSEQLAILPVTDENVAKLYALRNKPIPGDEGHDLARENRCGPMINLAFLLYDAATVADVSATKFLEHSINLINKRLSKARSH
jgi:hypothetical protein